MHSHVYTADERPDVIVLFDPAYRSPGTTRTWRVGELRRVAIATKAAGGRRSRGDQTRAADDGDILHSPNIRPTDDEQPRQNLGSEGCCLWRRGLRGNGSSAQGAFMTESSGGGPHAARAGIGGVQFSPARRNHSSCRGRERDTKRRALRVIDDEPHEPLRFSEPLTLRVKRPSRLHAGRECTPLRRAAIGSSNKLRSDLGLDVSGVCGTGSWARVGCVVEMPRFSVDAQARRAVVLASATLPRRPRSHLSRSSALGRPVDRADWLPDPLSVLHPMDGAQASASRIPGILAGICHWPSSWEISHLMNIAKPGRGRRSRALARFLRRKMSVWYLAASSASAASFGPMGPGLDCRYRNGRGDDHGSVADTDLLRSVASSDRWTCSRRRCRRGRFFTGWRTVQGVERWPGSRTSPTGCCRWATPPFGTIFDRVRSKSP